MQEEFREVAKDGAEIDRRACRGTILLIGRSAAAASNKARSVSEA